MHASSWLGVTLVAALSIPGCEPKVAQKPPPPPPPEVFVATAIRQQVIDYEEYPGRLVATETVHVRSRVSGYLEKVHFKDGDSVRAGDLLFEIDSRPFKAELDRASAAVATAQVQLERAQSLEKRARLLAETRAISEENLELAGFNRAAAEASLTEAKAQLEVARLDLDYTQITAKIGGKISRRLADPGNLVKSDDTPLATIVATDPVYAYFAIDERTVLELQRLIRSGALAYNVEAAIPVDLALADQEEFTLRGLINFFDNQVDPATGTLTARAVVENPTGLLTPGLFVRMRTPMSALHDALLVPEEALGSDQGQRFLYVVDDANKVTYRRVKVGQASEGRRVITEGLQPEDRVVVTGLQRIRPGVVVNPKPWQASADVAQSPTAR